MHGPTRKSVVQGLEQSPFFQNFRYFQEFKDEILLRAPVRGQELTSFCSPSASGWPDAKLRAFWRVSARIVMLIITMKRTRRWRITCVDGASSGRSSGNVNMPPTLRATNIGQQTNGSLYTRAMDVRAATSSAEAGANPNHRSLAPWWWWWRPRRGVCSVL